MLLEELFEAAIPAAKTGTAMTKVISYLERQLGTSFQKLWIEKFKNSKGSGFGVRYIESGTVNSIRFNWVGSKSSSIVSVDLWNGTSHDPNFHIEFDDVSLAQSLPTLAKVLKSPKVGRVKVTKEVQLAEAKKGEFTPESAIADMIEKLESGRTFNRSEFVMNYHPENAFAYDEFIDKFKDDLVFSGKRISLPKGEKLGTTKAKTKSVDAKGELVVSKGGSGEEYDVPEVDRIEEEDHVSFSDSLEHLEALTNGIIKGSFNALFVAGKGGTGKTQTVEDTLAKAGLTDGNGYFKITGSASPIGMYEALYRNRDGIVLFDDSDGALETQDGRNIIKAATDTKRVRKLAWSKRTSGMYDPDTEAPKTKDEAAEGEDGFDEDEPEDTRLPKHFQFTGRVIFISNLPINKLDPDGALRTRAFLINIDPTPEEIFGRMEEIVNHIRLESGSLDMKERENVLKVVRSSKRANDASLRTLVRALNLASSGVPGWEKLVRLYA